MPIEFRCPQCGKLLRTPDASTGKKGKCPHCQAVTDIPLTSTAPTTPTPAPGGPPQSAPAPAPTDLFANLPGAAPNPAPPTGLGADLFGTPPPGSAPAAGGGVDLFANTPGSTPAPSSGTPDLFASTPTPAPASGPDLFSNMPGGTSSSAPTDLFGGTPSGASPPKDKAQALFADPFGPGVGGGGYGGGGGGGGGDYGGGGYASAPPNPYGAPSYAASQPSYGYGSGMQPHRAGLVLTLGIIALVSGLGSLLSICCICFFPLDIVVLAVGIPAAIFGHIDLAKMKQGVMDPSGHGSTMAGYIMGIVAVVLVLLSVVLFVIGLIFNIGMSAMQQQRFN